MSNREIAVRGFVNEKFGKNFYNFVNEYRVKEARILLISNEYENYSIEGIAKTAGFNSKSVFNELFKAHTGLTPKEFKENLNGIDLNFLFSINKNKDTDNV